jgi:hypothetical protein
MSLFSFRGGISWRSYVLASVALLIAQGLSQYFMADYLLTLPYAWHRISAAAADWNTWVRFPASLVGLVMWGAGEWTAEFWLLIPALLLDLAIAWMLVALSVRRARSTGSSLLCACLVLVPVIQIPAVIWLSTRPDYTPAADAVDERVSLEVAFKGLLAGVMLTLVLAVTSTLLLHVYGFGLFLASPFFIGCTTAYIANRSAPISQRSTTRLVFGACFLGGVGLLTCALEGLVCLVMAIPLIMVVAWLGGLAGRAIATKGAGGAPGSTAMSVAVLPLLFAVDLIAPPMAAFDNVESIEVAATDQQVWDAIVHMGPIPDPPIAPFRWGLAYPMSGTIQGSGVGAIREGVFSTGVAYERVTAWEPGRRLEFIVLSDPPTMHELSPHDHVNAPHVHGYFRTLDARFAITPLANGHTRLSLATRHELDLNPAFYWLPITKWAVHANKSRVLAHFARQAEAGSTPDRQPAPAAQPE